MVKIMYACFSVGGIVLIVSGAPPHRPSKLQGLSVSLIDKAANADRIFPGSEGERRGSNARTF